MRLTLLYGGLFLITTMAVLIPAGLLLQRTFDASAEEFIELAHGCGRRRRRRRPGVRADSADPDRGSQHAEYSVLGSQWVVPGVTIAVLGDARVRRRAGGWPDGCCGRCTGSPAPPAGCRCPTCTSGSRLTGPRDELKDLADTFDAMLDRLERSVDSQRRFVANASHELRTPLAIQRAAIEIGLADPAPANGSPGSAPNCCGQRSLPNG